MSYFLHRISHEWSISKPLFDRGYLTIGWGYLLGNEKAVSNVINHGSTEELNKLMYEVFETDYRKNRSLAVFSQFRPGDVIVVPLYGSIFSIVHVKSDPKPVTELPAFCA